MTRDESKSKANSYECKMLIDTIYDSLKSQICENCKHHRYIEKSYRVCDIIEIGTSDNFGCTLFESKK